MDLRIQGVFPGEGGVAAQAQGGHPTIPKATFVWPNG